MSAPRRCSDLSIELRVPPDWSRVESVRQATDLLVRSIARTAPEDLAAALSIVAGELMENAIKYGREGTSVEFTIVREPGIVRVSVANDVDRERGSVAMLKRRIDWLATYESPLAAYHASIAALDRGAEVEGTGLGLARILYEGECRLFCEIESGDRIRIEAVRDWPEAPRDAAEQGRNAEGSGSGGSGR